MGKIIVCKCCGGCVAAVGTVEDANRAFGGLCPYCRECSDNGRKGPGASAAVDKSLAELEKHRGSCFEERDA